MRKVLGIIAMLSVMFLLVSCAQDVEETNVADAVEEMEETAQVQVTGEVYQVVIENNKFMPVDLEVKVGDAVEWVNKDSVEHTVNFENGDFDEKLPVGTTTLTHTFMEKGEYPYFCKFHPGMRGSVIVS